RAEQDMIQHPGRFPARVGARQIGGMQVAAAQGRTFQEVLGVGVHVTHEYHMAVIGNAFADIGQLAGAGAGAQRRAPQHYQRASWLARVRVLSARCIITTSRLSGPWPKLVRMAPRPGSMPGSLCSSSSWGWLRLRRPLECSARGPRFRVRSWYAAGMSLSRAWWSPQS